MEMKQKGLNVFLMFSYNSNTGMKLSKHFEDFNRIHGGIEAGNEKEHFNRRRHVLIVKELYRT